MARCMITTSLLLMSASKFTRTARACGVRAPAAVRARARDELLVGEERDHALAPFLLELRHHLAREHLLGFLLRQDDALVEVPELRLDLRDLRVVREPGER